MPYNFPLRVSVGESAKQAYANSSKTDPVVLQISAPTTNSFYASVDGTVSQFSFNVYASFSSSLQGSGSATWTLTPGQSAVLQIPPQTSLYVVTDSLAAFGMMPVLAILDLAI